VIDTHAHVHDKTFEKDRAQIVSQARREGVSEIVTVGCDIEDSANAIGCAREFGLLATVGIHPHEAKDAPVDIQAALTPLLADPRVVAIGETGLDYYYDHSPHGVQQRCLREQVRIARKLGLPLIFHQRDAFDDFIAILREELKHGMPGVVHCFTGDAAQARTYVDEFNLKLGVGGILTFGGAQTLRDAIAAIGVEACVLETDCPYLAPVPHRGKRNEPAFIFDTARKLAEVCGRSLDEVVAISDANARELFVLP